jgi:hypothetical protein
LLSSANSLYFSVFSSLLFFPLSNTSGLSTHFLRTLYFVYSVICSKISAKIEINGKKCPLYHICILAET